MGPLEAPGSKRKSRAQKKGRKKRKEKENNSKKKRKKKKRKEGKEKEKEKKSNGFNHLNKHWTHLSHLVTPETENLASLRAKIVLGAPKIKM